LIVAPGSTDRTAPRDRQTMSPTCAAEAVIRERSVAGLIAAGGGRCVTAEEGAEIVVSDQRNATDSH
jgi:hypothetical protein